ncbi:Small-conductance mechanosensitive channel [Cohaesibacter sp. ES.047]|uniref:DUF3772 domain-containing protein n=1 Tax=Cohaesibacter sp. ES.047 TaxID=1798205 RepID=UPI000BB8A4FD|nr:DUF3772 domain-containing protein [Cohaesibacter sp. ES.047]SNY90849.1 Small-conductance mechanosensitive channel [Cohaesibacter sp. ES.047]
MIQVPFLRALATALLLLLMLALSPLAQAQQADTSLAESLTTRLDRIEAALNRDSLVENDFTGLREELQQVVEEASNKKDELQPTLTEDRARLEALKPEETEEGDTANPESATLKERRSDLEDQVAALDAEVKLLTANSVRATQMLNKITLARQQRFTEQLFNRSSSLLNPNLWLDGLTGLQVTGNAMSFLVSDWASFLSSKAAGQIWQIVGMILLIAFLIAGPLRNLLFNGVSRLARLETPNALQRSLHAAWSIFVYTFVPFLILFAVLLILKNAELVPPRVNEFINKLGYVILSISLGYGLVRVLTAPTKPQYRLLNLTTSSAHKLFGVAIVLLIITGIDLTFRETQQLLFTPIETTILISGVSAVLVAVLIWLAMRITLGDLEQDDDDQEDGMTSTPSVSADVSASNFLPGFISVFKPLVWLASVSIILSIILGYVSLGTFLAEQMLRIFVILALLGVFTALLDNFFAEGLDVSNPRVRKGAHSIGIPLRAVNQIGVLLNGLLRILLYIAAALLIFAPWGVQSTDFLSSMRRAIFSVEIGDLTISPIAILGALAVFFIALVLVRSVQRWMERSLLPATNLDTGLKNSIQTSVGYIGFIVAAMLAFSYMGLDLSNIALVAGALSVGIGFGLQSIVNNFVSGLILLVERPIKTGDWVVVGEHQGFVQKISVRATKIETFDRATVILPNSELISNRVMNWMHNGAMGRIVVPVGVSYDADPEQVREILKRVANESPLVASYPEPDVYFLNFGDSSLDFDVRCYVHDVLTSLVTSSELRFEIFKALKEAGIEIPYPQRDVHIRSVSSPNLDKQLALSPDEAQETREPAAPRQDEVDLPGASQGVDEGPGQNA